MKGLLFLDLCVPQSQVFDLLAVAFLYLMHACVFVRRPSILNARISTPCISKLWLLVLLALPTQSSTFVRGLLFFCSGNSPTSPARRPRKLLALPIWTATLFSRPIYHLVDQ